MIAFRSQMEARPRRSSLAMMLVLVACVGVLFWAWRRASEGSVAKDLASTIRSGSAAEREVAMTVLSQIPPDQAWAAAPALFSALDDPDAQIRSRASEALLYALQDIADPQEAAIAAERLTHALGNRDPIVRAAAAGLLGTVHQSLKPSAATGTGSVQLLPARVVEVLIVACDDPDAKVRAAAVDSLAAGMGDRAAKVRMLLKAVTDADAGVRSVAVTRLFPLANQSRAACLAVVRALNDPVPQVRYAAFLGRFNASVVVPVEAVPGLIRAMDDHTAMNIQWQALRHLETMGPAGKDAIPAVLARLRKSSETEAVRALGSIAPGCAEARALIPPLLASLKDRKSPRGDRYQAVQALTTFLWDGEVLAAMRQAAKDPDETVRFYAVDALASPSAPVDRIEP